MLFGDIEVLEVALRKGCAVPATPVMDLERWGLFSFDFKSQMKTREIVQLVVLAHASMRT